MISEGQPYYRLSGNGNDFLALVEPMEVPSADRIRAWCRRGIGLGADGLFVLRRPPTASDPGIDEATPTVLMDHFNADGGQAELCLNGTRCAARLAFALGWAEDEIVVETHAGPMRATSVNESAIRVEVPQPSPPRLHQLTLPGHDSRLSVWFVEVGVPHAVLEASESLARLDTSQWGPALRHHQEFAPRGVNVDFVRFVQRSRLELRTWERGVEAETLACGTGILAAVRVGLELERLELPLEVQTLGGFPTRVEAAPPGAAPRWALVSDARVLARGEITAQAEITPPPARWSD